MVRYFLLIALYFQPILLFAQAEKEVVAPYNIKTVSFIQNAQNVVPVFKLGELFQLHFDDLFSNEQSYFYEIIHCDYNWNPSELQKNEYLEGFDNQRIVEYSNSFNTLQSYSHYKLVIPNQNTRLKLSGNYMLKILNENKQVVFSRNFILYEDLVSIPIQVKRARTVPNMAKKQNLEFTITTNTINFKNLSRNLKILVFQNNTFQNAITNVQPQYTIGNDLVYKYDAETQFWGGNEYLYFDNKEIRIPANFISRVDNKNEVYSAYLFPHTAQANFPHSITFDVNGNFAVRRLMADSNEVEADYAWVYFTLLAPPMQDETSAIYVNGMFNNYALTSENKMDYNPQNGIYQKAILIKQGFTNYQYIIANSEGEINFAQSVDGNFYQTENDYTVLVYYRENTDRYDRVIGRGTANSSNIIN